RVGVGAAGAGGGTATAVSCTATLAVAVASAAAAGSAVACPTPSGAPGSGALRVAPPPDPVELRVEPVPVTVPLPGPGPVRDEPGAAVGGSAPGGMVGARVATTGTGVCAAAGLAVHAGEPRATANASAASVRVTRPMDPPGHREGTANTNLLNGAQPRGPRRVHAPPNTYYSGFAG